MIQEEKIYINVGGERVCLDRSRLFFNEATLNDYIQTEGGWIDYFGSKLADAERELADLEISISDLQSHYEKVYAEKFISLNNSSSKMTVKHIESAARLDQDVEAAELAVYAEKRKLIAIKHKIRLLQLHLRAWDKNHENAQSRGHFIRKEMDKLYGDIMGSKYVDNYVERKVSEVVKEIDTNRIDYDTDFHA